VVCFSFLKSQEPAPLAAPAASSEGDLLGRGRQRGAPGPVTEEGVCVCG